MKVVDGRDQLGAKDLVVAPPLILSVELVQGQPCPCLVDNTGEREGFLYQPERTPPRINVRDEQRRKERAADFGTFA